MKLRTTPCLLPLMLALGCSSSSSEEQETEEQGTESAGELREYYGSKQPGDIVLVSIDDLTMTLDNVTTNETLELTLGSSLGGFDAGTYESGGGTHSGLYVELAGQGVLALGAYEDAVVVGSAVGACPDGDSYEYNYMFTLDCHFEPSTDSALGVLAMTKNGDVYDLSLTTYTIGGDEVDVENYPGAACDQGIITVPNTDITFGVTPDGFLIGDHGPGQGAGAGFPVPADDPSAADIGAVELFRGFYSKTIADEEEGVGEAIATIPVEGEGTGTGLDGYSVNAFQDGEREGPFPFTFDGGIFSDQPGLLGGTFIDSEFAFMTGTVDGKRLVYGVTWGLAAPGDVPEGEDLSSCNPGVDPDDPNHEVYINPSSLFIVEQ